MLLKRQSGHAMVSPPEDKDLMPFIINDMDSLNQTVRRVRRVWTRIIRIDQEQGKKNVVVKEPFILWVKEQAQIVNISFFFEPSSRIPEPKPILQEDVDKLTNKIKELELENPQLRVQLNYTKQRNKDLEDKGEKVKEEFERNKKRLREVRGKRGWVGGALLGANFEINFRNNKLDQSWRTVKDLEKTIELSNAMKKASR